MKTFLISLGCVFLAVPAFAADPLPSWNDTAPKKAIIEFVEKVTKEGSPDFVPAPERIATFDNDGTLWSEQPMYFQLFFALRPGQGARAAASRVEGQGALRLAPQGRRERRRCVRREGVAGNRRRHARGDDHRRVREDRDRLDRHREASEDRASSITEMVYQPMLELLAYLRANGFKTFIVSGGGIEFMRPWTEQVYGIPPEQVVGSQHQDEVRDARRQTRAHHACRRLNFIDDKAGKPVGINSHIGRRPIAAFGNSDGDLQMLEWTAGRQRRAADDAGASRRRKARVGLRSRHRKSALSATRSWPRQTKAAGPSSA